MFSHLTGQARQAFQLAHRRAVELNHDYVGSEHLLAALLQESSGAVPRLLRACDVDATALRDALERDLLPAARTLALERLPLTQAVMRVLDNAAIEAEMRQAQPGLEHLLLGVLLEGDSQAAQLLAQHGLMAERCRRELATLRLADNRDHLVRETSAAQPSAVRDPSALELEDRITTAILPREWHPGQLLVWPQANVRDVETQLFHTQTLLAALLGLFVMGELYHSAPAMGLGAALGCIVGMFQSSLLGAVYGGVGGFFIGWQYRETAPLAVIPPALLGAYLGSWIGNFWRPTTAARTPEPARDVDDA